jgi:hypothetical protein
MPKRKEPELEPKEQFKRFQETAGKLEVSEAESERTFAKLALKKKAGASITKK